VSGVPWKGRAPACCESRAVGSEILSKVESDYLVKMFYSWQVGLGQTRAPKSARMLPRTRSFSPCVRARAKDAEHLYMVLEFVPGGDLMSILIEKDVFTGTARACVCVRLPGGNGGGHRARYRFLHRRDGVRYPRGSLARSSRSCQPDHGRRPCTSSASSTAT
jgi:hypothetical protein